MIFIDCFVCGERAQLTDSDELTDAEVRVQFEAQGWTIQPTRCPDHIGLADDHPGTPRDACAEPHDPQPYETRGLPRFAHEPARFRPRPGYCPWRSHYT